MDIFLFIDILCTGIVLANAILLITFGSKILSTVFNGIFWLYLFFYLLISTLNQADILNIPFLIKKVHYYIPVFYTLFILISIYNNKFKLFFLTVFILPLPLLLIPTTSLMIILYHLIAWIILIFVTTYFRIKKKESKQKIVSLTVIQILLIFLSVFPFIIVNLILVLILKQNLVLENILPPCLAIASFLMILFTYNLSLLKLNHDYYANIDMLKKASLTEKKTIIEKITASLVHEIKNPITAIQSLNGQLLSNYKTIKDDKALEYLTVIDEELKRTKNIIEEFLKIYKKNNSNNKENIDLHDSIESIKNLLNIDLNNKSVKISIDDSLKKKIY